MTSHPDPEVLRTIIEEAPSLTAAAAQLGISRPTLYRWMAEANIKPVRRHHIPTPGEGSAA